MNSDYKVALLPYALGIAGVILMLVPHSIVPFTGVSCLLTGFFGSYIIRIRSENNQLKDNMTHFIRTIWIGASLLAIGFLLFLSIIYANADFSSLKNFESDANSGVIATNNEVKMMRALFFQSNSFLIFMTACVCFVPIPVFMAYRMLNGVRRIVSS
jgi:hypothetical protein